MTLADRTVMAVTTRALAFALGLVLLTMPAWGQARQTGEQAAQRWFRVSWAPPTEGVVSSIKGSVFNDSPYRVTDVRLQVEGLDPDRQPVGQTLVWAFGDIAPGGETSFVAEPVPGAVSYRITVVSYDLVSLFERLDRCRHDAVSFGGDGSGHDDTVVAPQTLILTLRYVREIDVDALAVVGGDHQRLSRDPQHAPLKADGRIVGSASSDGQHAQERERHQRCHSP